MVYGTLIINATYLLESLLILSPVASFALSPFLRFVDTFYWNA